MPSSSRSSRYAQKVVFSDQEDELSDQDNVPQNIQGHDIDTRQEKRKLKFAWRFWVVAILTIQQRDVARSSTPFVTQVSKLFSSCRDTSYLVGRVPVWKSLAPGKCKKSGDAEDREDAEDPAGSTQSQSQKRLRKGEFVPLLFYT